MILSVRGAANLRRSASAEKSWTSHTWKWTNEPSRSRKKGPERESDTRRTTARALPPAGDPVREPHQRAGIRQDAAAGEDAGAHGQERSGCRVNGRPADRKRRAASGEVRISGKADRHWRDVSSGCAHGGEAPGRLEAGRPRFAHCGKCRKPGVPVEL